MDLQALVAEVQPLVEEAAGRCFRRIPHVRPTTLRQLRRLLIDETSGHHQRVVPDFTRQAARMYAGWDADKLHPYPFARYNPADGTLYTRFRALRPALRLAEQDDRAAAAVARLLLAHELARALQDQEVGIDAVLGRSTTLDAFHACGAVLAGHATAVELAVADRAGLGDAKAPLNVLRLRTHPWPIVRLYYEHGPAFVRAVAESPSTAWDVVRAPPHHTRGVYRPERRDEPVIRAPSGDAWPVLARILGLKGSAHREPLGEFGFRESLHSKDRRQTEAPITSAFRTGCVLYAEQASAALYVFADEDAASLLVAFAADPHRHWARDGARVASLDLYGDVRADEAVVARALKALLRW
jgi:hypothetical protein